MKSKLKAHRQAIFYSTYTSGTSTVEIYYSNFFARQLYAQSLCSVGRLDFGHRQNADLSLEACAEYFLPKREESNKNHLVNGIATITSMMQNQFMILIYLYTF